MARKTKWDGQFRAGDIIATEKAGQMRITRIVTGNDGRPYIKTGPVSGEGEYGWGIPSAFWGDVRFVARAA